MTQPRLFWLPRWWPFRVAALTLLVLAVRAHFVGYPSYTLVFFAQLYVFAFVTSFVLLPISFTRELSASAHVVLSGLGATAAWYSARFRARDRGTELLRRMRDVFSPAA